MKENITTELAEIKRVIKEYYNEEKRKAFPPNMRNFKKD